MRLTANVLYVKDDPDLENSFTSSGFAQKVSMNRSGFAAGCEAWLCRADNL